MPILRDDIYAPVTNLSDAVCAFFANPRAAVHNLPNPVCVPYAIPRYRISDSDVIRQIIGFFSALSRFPVGPPFSPIWSGAINPRCPTLAEFADILRGLANPPISATRLKLRSLERTLNRDLLANPPISATRLKLRLRISRGG